MREGVIFEVTKDHLETGLYGVPAGFCVTSHVDPKKGLFYAGRPIAGLIHRSVEEIIYLLYRGEMGTFEEVASFSDRLLEKSTCHPDALKQIASLPKTDRVMDAFASAILIAGMYENGGNYEEDAISIIAKIPHIAASVINRQESAASPHISSANGYIERFVEMLALKKDQGLLHQALSLYCILNLDHGGGDLSTFVGKAVSSGHENMYGSIAAAITSFGGKHHGGACQEGFSFVQKASDALGIDPSPSSVQEFLQSELSKKGKIPGFGDAVLQIEDPRATICYEFCMKNMGDDPLVKTALLLKEAGTSFLKENTNGEMPFPTLDAISGTMLYASGFKSLKDAPILLGLARTVGIAIQIVYERMYAKEGQGTPMMRPSYIYKHRL